MFFDPKNLWKRKKTCFFLLEFLRSGRCFFWYRPPGTSPPPVPPVPDPWTTERPLSCIFNVGKALDGVILRGDDKGYAWHNQKAAWHAPSNIPHKTTIPGTLQQSKHAGEMSLCPVELILWVWWRENNLGEGRKKTKCRAQLKSTFFLLEKKGIDAIRRELSPLWVSVAV